MPIYEYKCKNCDCEFELIQKLDDPEIQECTFCGGDAKRKVSQSSFVLKGDGWFSTSNKS